MNRAEPYAAAHDASARRGRDRIKDKPRNMRTLLRWLVREYGMEPPVKLHSGAALEEDGDPAMTALAKSWFGMNDDREPTPWTEVACRTDPDGYYVTPMRCALAHIPSTERRHLLSELAVNLLFPRDVMNAHGIPAWAQNDVMAASLSMLWDTYSDRRIPKAKVGWVDKSQAQRDAEDAA